MRFCPGRYPPFFVVLGLAAIAARASAPTPGPLFYLSCDHGTTADFSAAGTPRPTYDFDVTPTSNGARNDALQCGNYQLLAYRAPGNIYAQRGTLSFFWRSRYPVGPTAFPIFRVGYGDHSSWDMVFLRVDYNGHGFDAFVTDANLSRTRVSVPLNPFPSPKSWTHLAVAWDENVGLRFYINGALAAHVDTKTRYDLALDQFGPHSRIISPHQVQSDYNFVRGGDIDEIRIYDHMLGDSEVASLAAVTNGIADTEGDQPTQSVYPRTLNDPAVEAEWAFRYGWNRTMPPELPAIRNISIRKVEIHDAYDLKRWWWKANDGIVETTWPGVYNRSRLPGRNDYFQLPDWDCYVESGKAITFVLPDEPCNHLELTGAAWGKMEVLPENTDPETAYLAKPESLLFERAPQQEKTIHALGSPLAGREIRFTNVEQEQPIAELGAYNVVPGTAPAGSRVLEYRIGHQLEPTDDSLRRLAQTIARRYPPDERTTVFAFSEPATTAAHPSPSASASSAPPLRPALPLVHLLVPDGWDTLSDGLDGIELELPSLNLTPSPDGLIALNIQIKDPLWPARNLCDFTFSVRPRDSKILWFDLRDRLLPAGKPLWIAIASSSPDFTASSLSACRLRLVFKAHDAAKAEHVADRLTQVKDVYAMMVEEHPHDKRLAMWNQFEADLSDLLRVDPTNELGLEYRAFGVPGAPRPAFDQPVPPAGIPLWAFRQVTLLGQIQHFVEWYIDHRQVAYGDFGGGISDDVDLLNTWPGVALMGCVPEKIAASNAALLDAAVKNGMFTNGLPTIQADELHSYEEGIDCLGQNLIVNFGSPRELERAMITARGVESLTGINAAGHRHIRTSYYNGKKQAWEDPWGYAKPYSYLVLQVPQLLVDYNGNPWTKKYLLELADGLLAHHHVDATRRHGPSVPAIHFSDDREDDVGRGYFPWHVFWAAYRFTGDQHYLAPILDGGMTSLANLNPDVLDLLDLRDSWGSRLERGERAVVIEGRRDTGRTRERTTGYRSSNSEHFEWQLTGDKSYLEKLYAEQIETCGLLDYINTKGSLWIDRVGVPYAELQRARLGGVALVRNAVFPGHAISWKFAAPATAESVAILVPSATRTAFKVIAYNLDQAPVRATMTGWNIDPGVWEITQGIDTHGTDHADADLSTRSAKFERSSSLDFVLPPRATTVLTLQLKTPGTPYWQRPDVGIDPQDVTIGAGAIHVCVHSLGSVPSPSTKLVVRNAVGQVVATAVIPPLEPPLDLKPKTADVSIAVPADVQLAGATIELDPDHAVEEITRLNNVVRL